MRTNLKSPNKNRTATFFLLTLLTAAPAFSADLPPLKTVKNVDIQRYLGTWHEIAAIPQSFQEGCEDTKANYSLNRAGDVRVVNTCTVDGKPKRARGKAWIVDNVTNAKLKVQFFWPFKGDYWIIELDEDYRYAVVGEPDRDYLWILSRDKDMPDDVYEELMDKITDQHHYDESEIVKTIHTQ